MKISNLILIAMLAVVMVISGCVSTSTNANTEMAMGKTVTIYNANQNIENSNDVKLSFNQSGSQIWENTVAAGGSFDLTNYQPFFDYVTVKDYDEHSGYCPGEQTVNETTGVVSMGSTPCTPQYNPEDVQPKFIADVPIALNTEQHRINNGVVEIYAEYWNGDETSGGTVWGWIRSGRISYYIFENGTIRTTIRYSSGTGTE